MNTRSIRFRIIIWYSLILFATTAFTFFSFYFVTRQILYNQVDKELITHALLIKQTINDHISDLHITSLQGEVSNQFKDTPGMVVVLLDQNGATVLSSISMDTPFISYQYLFDQARNSKDAIYINQDISNMPMRFIAQPLRDSNGNLFGILLVAHPIDAIQKSLNFLPFVLGIILFFLIFPVLFLAQFLTGKVIHPIKEISEQMEKITSEDLTRRIKNPATNDEIQKLAVSFNALLERVQKSFEHERQFIGDVAHELKTPIATLQGEIELTLSQKRSIKRYKKALEESLIDTNRLSKLVKNVLDLAWARADNKEKDKSIDLSNTIKEIREMAIRLAAGKKIKIKSKIAPRIIVKASQEKITRALFNIVENAIKYTPVNGEVSISLRTKDDNVIIEIKDTGVGIPENELNHVFERFYRGSKTTKVFGSGLGLAIAQSIIESYQGKITIESKVGKGTTVFISLPLLKES